jgi:UDP-N-acetylmuramoyl-L-alanyl-D-glutamate--2,6-diaminopimelate ligase
LSSRPWGEKQRMPCCGTGVRDPRKGPVREAGAGEIGIEQGAAMRLSEIARRIGCRNIIGFVDAEATGVADDSRKTQRGDAFCAVVGERVDGGVFAPLAVQAGAAAVVAERPCAVSIPQLIVPDVRRAAAEMCRIFYKEPLSAMRFVGITGTNGKTTTAFMVRHLLNRAGLSTGMIGTVVCDLAGVEQAASMTTPGPVDLCRMIGKMYARGARVCVMEVSSHAIDQQRVAMIDFDAAVFTNLSQDHLDYHRTMKAYLAAKARLFAGLRKDAFAVINAESPAGDFIAQQSAGKALWTGLHPGVDVRAQAHAMTPDGTEMTMHFSAGRGGTGVALPLTLPCLGRFNAENAASAAGACRALGLSPAQIAEGLATFTGVPGRLERIERGQPFRIIVDYAHTPDALANVLEMLNELNPRRIITVFGCGGDRDRGKRAKMAAAVEAGSGMVIVTQDNPRTEDPAQILADIMKGFERPGAATVAQDRAQAIRLAIAEAREGDVVLIAGKGHEDYQIIGRQKTHFDDRQVALEALAALRGAKAA